MDQEGSGETKELEAEEEGEEEMMSNDQLPSELLSKVEE
jgi:hypothetical protein